LRVEIINQPHRSVAEVAPGVPADLAQIVDEALAKDRNQRIRTARELADRLEGVAARITESPPALYGTRTPTLAGGPGNQRAPTTQNAWSEAPPDGARRRGTIALAVSLTVMAFVISGLVAYFRARPPLVAVAGRSAVSLAAALSRLKAEVEREALAEVKAREQKAAEVTNFNPSDLPPAHEPPSSAPAASPATPSQRPPVVHGRPASPGPKNSIPVQGPGF
jgi:hypothetical protein